MNDSPALSDVFPPVPDEDWLDRLRRDLGDNFEEQLTWAPLEGIDIQAFYRRASTESLPHVAEQVHSQALRTPRDAPNDWIVAQRLPLDATSLNTRIASACSGGANRIVVTATGTDASADLSAALSTAQTVANEHDVSLHLDGGADALAVLQRTNNLEALPTTYADARMMHAFGYTVPSEAVPSHPHPIVVDMRRPHAVGVPMAKSLALGLASLSEALHAQSPGVLEAGVPHTLLVSVDTSYFLEIAKLRALRLLVPQVIQAYADTHDVATSVRPADVTLYAETSPRSHTLFDPHANLLRAATQSAAAVIGGADQLVVAPFRRDAHDEQANADRLARNTQLILKHEAHLHRVADPAAGAYYIEHATHRLAQAVWTQFQAIESDGGFSAWTHDALFAEFVQNAQAARTRRMAQRKDVLVGTNHYPDPDTPASLPPTPAVSPAEQTFDVDPPAWAQPLHLSTPYDALRLRIQALDERPTALLVPVGIPAIRSARATFARNIIGCLGLDLVEPLGYDSVEAALDAVDEQTPDVVVWCTDDDTLPTLINRALTRSLDAITLTAAPPDAVPHADDVDLLLHRGASIRKRLEQLTDLLTE